MIRLICCDVDGTLIGASGTVLPIVEAAVARARARGIRLAVSSGRPSFGSTRQLAELLDPTGWHVFQNGASVLHLESGSSLSAPIPPATVAMLIERARRLRRVLELYSDSAYVVENGTERARRHAGLLGTHFEPRPFDTFEAGVVRAQWLLAHDELAEVLAEEHPDLEISPSTAPVMPDTLFVNLTPSGVSKASGVRAVARAYGVPLSEVMFVGDGGNDVSALQAVGFPVAMGNAEPAAREAARFHVGHVERGGLAKAIELALDA